MKRASFGQWMVVVAVVGVVGLAACGGKEAVRGVTTPLLVTPPARVVVTPASITMGLGTQVQFHAIVVDSGGSPTLNQSVVWSVSPSPGPVAISDSGVVTDECYPTTNVTVVARSVADTLVGGTAQILAVTTALPGISISAIDDAATGAPANLDSLTDSVRVVVNLDQGNLPCVAAQELDLLVHRAAGDTVVDRVAFESTTPPSGSVTLTFHSDAKVGGVAQFPNGQYSMQADLIFGAGSSPQPSSTFNFTIKNP